MSGQAAATAYPRRVDFEEALARLGFAPAEERARRGTRLFEARPNRFLTYWVHVFEDGTALFTWEFAIGEYAAALGMQVGSDEHLNTFLFPREDARGPQDAAWIASQLERTEAALRAFTLLDG